MADIFDSIEYKKRTPVVTLELIMCPPKYLSTDISNNKWMKKLSKKEKEVNVDKALSQFYHIVSIFSQDAIVYLLPPTDGLQDQVYTSNAGISLPHTPEPTIILSNFTAEGRPGEEDELDWLAKKLEYKTVKCPYKFEGEAEMKWIRDNIYIGGYGMRSDKKAFEWMQEEYDCQMILAQQTDPLVYHLDCSIFVMDKETVIYNEDFLKGAALKEVKKYAECIPITKKEAQFSLTNSVRIGSVVYLGSPIKEMKWSDEEFIYEKQKIDTMEKICHSKGLELIVVNISEFNRSGAALSCLCFHLSRIAFEA